MANNQSKGSGIEESIQDLRVRIGNQLLRKAAVRLEEPQDLLAAASIACAIGSDEHIAIILKLMSKSISFDETYGSEDYGAWELHSLATFTEAWRLIKAHLAQPGV